MKTLKPVWNEEFKFPLSKLKDEDEFLESIVLFELWDWDFLKKNDYIGSIKVKLKEIPPENGLLQWFDLPCFEKTTNALYLSKVKIKLEFIA